MLYAFQHLFLRRFVALQLVGDDHPWHEAWFFQKFAEESLRRLCVPMLLEQDIQHFPLRIPCPPQIVLLLFERHHLIEMPFIGAERTFTTKLIGILLSELATPFPDGLISKPVEP